ncbi:DUF2569 family protein [Pseudodesulfovibrio cashew]|uniref:DUF2569 family protein n=1 Tax=Pseudodesulfovibrio cashew TaxID=2678688 RepID=A0A6I6J808_9BACT|nr:DUF2569 family protein [Pseudodesulfovibrio cashew]QGY38685.1 DUF2569 family protein [Pseudodesulfovibrio cashew]
MGESGSQNELVLCHGKDGLPKLGGWLLLLAAGQLLTIGVRAWDISGLMETIRHVDPAAMDLVLPIFRFEIGVAVSQIVLSAGLLFLLLTKRRLFVRAYIVAMIAMHLMNIVDLLWLRSMVYLMFNEMAMMLGRIAAGVVASGLWIWYLLVSRRVKLTLIR